jgi:hypothetical protein
VATEVPVYLTPEDASYMKNKLKFNLPFFLEDPFPFALDTPAEFF